MAVVLFSLRAKDNLCIKDKEAAPNVYAELVTLQGFALELAMTGS